MPLEIRVDVFLHIDALEGQVQQLVALTQQLKTRNDQLAQAVAELSPVANRANEEKSK